MLIKRPLLFCLILLVACLHTKAAIQLPSFISSNMVLQQKTTVPLWGWSDAGKQVTIYTSWNKKTYTTKAGATGEWRVIVATPTAGGPFKIRISDGEEISLDNVLIGEVWLCSGQSNMEIPMEGFERAKMQPIKNSEEIISTSENKNIRLFTVKKTDSAVAVNNCSGQWQQAVPETVKKFSAVAYQYAKLLQDKLNVPIGIIASSWGGTPIEAWMSERALNEVMFGKSNETVFQKRRSGLYNAMIYPLKDFAIKGFLWYQGESNKVNANVYDELMASMVKDWRKQWNNEKLPFYFVQIAPWDNDTKNAGMIPSLWEAQAKAEKNIPYSAMAVINDAGEQHNIHPADKTTVAQRLLLIALGKTYGYKNITYAGPVFNGLRVQKDTAYVYFENAQNGLKSSNNKLTLFEVAGDDKMFYPADAVITSTGVAVHSKEVKKPVAVRYAFKDWVVGELYNKEGLPASAFRTDDW